MRLEKEDLLKIYYNLVLTRKLDETCIKALYEGRIRTFFHSGQGNEATAVGGVTFLRKDDWVIGAARGHGLAQYIAKGLSPKAFLAEHYGKATGCCRGWSGFHTADMELGIPGMAGTLGSSFSLATGLGIACKTKGKGQLVVCYFGDGASNRGPLHECFNLAALWKLPIVWVCENNQYAVFMHVSEHYAGKDIADLAYGYGMPGVVVDGQDVVAVCEAVMSGVERARAGEGPSLVECKTLRLRPHMEGAPYLRGTTPVPEEELEEIKKRDPVKLFQEKLLEQGILTQSDVERIDRQVTAEVEDADRFARESPPPDPEEMFKSVYAD